MVGAAGFTFGASQTKPSDTSKTAGTQPAFAFGKSSTATSFKFGSGTSESEPSGGFTFGTPSATSAGETKPATNISPPKFTVFTFVCFLCSLDTIEYCQKKQKLLVVLFFLHVYEPFVLVGAETIFRPCATSWGTPYYGRGQPRGEINIWGSGPALHRHVMVSRDGWKRALGLYADETYFRREQSGRPVRNWHIQAKLSHGLSKLSFQFTKTVAPDGPTPASDALKNMASKVTAPAGDKPSFGGFTFTGKPVITTEKEEPKAAEQKKEEQAKPAEAAKVNPFASFRFVSPQSSGKGIDNSLRVFCSFFLIFIFFCVCV